MIPIIHHWAVYEFTRSLVLQIKLAHMLNFRVDMTPINLASLVLILFNFPAAMANMEPMQKMTVSSIDWIQSYFRWTPISAGQDLCERIKHFESETFEITTSSGEKRRVLLTKKERSAVRSLRWPEGRAVTRSCLLMEALSAIWARPIATLAPMQNFSIQTI